MCSREDTCCACGYLGSQKAHVKDKSTLIKEGIKDHEFRNIVCLCISCHYEFFDQGKLGIKRLTTGRHLFILLDKDNTIRELESNCIINVLDDYLKWKNKQCNSRLLIRLFR